MPHEMLPVRSYRRVRRDPYLCPITFRRTGLFQAGGTGRVDERGTFGGLAPASSPALSTVRHRASATGPGSQPGPRTDQVGHVCAVVESIGNMPESVADTQDMVARRRRCAAS